MMRPLAALTLILALTGCIPPSAPKYATDRNIPRIEAEPEVFTDEQPVWDMQPVTANAAEVEAGGYIVKPGDTLRGIGNRTGAGSETLARVNNIPAPYILRPGQRLAVPGGRYHSVAAGETGIAIARAYAVSWGEIISLNELTEPFALRIGQRLLLPAGAANNALSVSATAPTMEARAKSFKLNIDDIITGGEPAFDPRVAVARPMGSRPLPPSVAVAEPAQFSGNFMWPAAGRVESRFGAMGEGQKNQGIDIAVSPSTPIMASSNGVVAFVGNDVAPYGGLILIRHGDGWITAYGRAVQANVTRGQSVKRGQTIGRAGTGSAPLLFFQMRKDRVPVDPIKSLPPR